MRQVAYLLEGILILLVATVPFQLSVDALSINAYGMAIILLFFTLITGLCGAYLLKESSSNDKIG